MPGCPCPQPARWESRQRGVIIFFGTELGRAATAGAWMRARWVNAPAMCVQWRRIPFGNDREILLYKLASRRVLRERILGGAIVDAATESERIVRKAPRSCAERTIWSCDQPSWRKQRCDPGWCEDDQIPLHLSCTHAHARQHHHQ